VSNYTYIGLEPALSPMAEANGNEAWQKLGRGVAEDSGGGNYGAFASFLIGAGLTPVAFRWDSERSGAAAAY